MPRIFDVLLEEDRPGNLVIEKQSEDCIEAFYTPSKERLELTGLPTDSATEYRVKLLHINWREQRLTIFPTNTRVGHTRFLKPKHDQIERITIADGKFIRTDFSQTAPSTEDEVMMVLEDLPSCFVKNYHYGLGLTQHYRFIIDAVENLSDCTEVVITKQEQTGPNENDKVFYISTDDFETVRKAINRTSDASQTAARSINTSFTQNFFAEKLGQAPTAVKTGRSPLRKQITNFVLADEDLLLEHEKDDLLHSLESNAKSIAETKPAKLASLQKELELVSLGVLIERYEEMIKSRLVEGKWQVFFDENPFLLSLAFSRPVIKIRDQASVGGRKLSGAGEKITDFLVKNSMTNNSAIVEIKRPDTKLLNANPLRGGVYTPSGELVSAINQALDQKYQFEREIVQLKENSQIYDIKSYSVQCAIIIGTLPSGEDQLKSFELFRGNLKNVDIITFNELLEKLKYLRDFMSSEGSNVAN